MCLDKQVGVDSLVWLMSNKTVNNSVYKILADLTKERFILLPQGTLNPEH